MSEKPKPTVGLSQVKRELLARLLKKEGVGAALREQIEPRRQFSPCPLSFAQQRLWFLHQLESQSCAYNVPAAIRLKGQLNVAALERTLNEIVRRHEILRTRFAMIDGQPMQLIDEPSFVWLPVINLSRMKERVREAESLRIAREEAQAPFDLEQERLWRARLLRLSADEHIVLLTMHHIVSDEWSVGVLIKEICALYKAYAEGLPSPLEPLPIQYADFAVWQKEWLKGAVLEGQLAYWKERLAGVPPLLELPTDRTPSANQKPVGARQSFKLPPELAQEVKDLSQRSGTTLFMTLLAAWAVLLSRYSGQSDIAIGTPIANRHRSELESLIGFFVNTLVLRANLSGNPRFVDVLKQVREVALGAYAHQDLPFEHLVEQLQPERDLGQHPLFRVIFMMQSTPDAELDMPGLELSALEVDNGMAKFDLVLAMVQTDEGLTGTFKYNATLFNPTTIERMGAHYRRMLESLVAAPEQRILDADYIPEAELVQLEEWSEARASYAEYQCIHKLFEAQVQRRPDATALVYGQASLTYEELNERANRLAHHLQTLGVGRGTIVALCMERSLEMVIGLLGVLKAGGAYLCLDPENPAERLAFILGDIDASVILTQENLRGRLPERGAALVCLDADWTSIAQCSRESPQSDVSSDELAYLTYTSGSTGQPKGTEIPHRSVMGFMFGVSYADFDERQTWLQHSSTSWDALTLELWTALLHGSRCVLYPGAFSTLEELGQLVREQEVTTLWLTSSLFNAIVDRTPDLFAGVKQIMTGGESLSVSHIRRAREVWPTTRLVNGYGPSECTVFCCCNPLEEAPDEEAHSIPVGKPIGDRKVYLLDSRLRRVGAGIAGEIYVGGAGVGRGYHRRPELTAESFVPDPFSREAGARLYKTGDLGRYLADGQIEFLGRADHQVKIRGFRIELGEIEAKLLQAGGVREAVVIARMDQPGEKRLAAYVVFEKGVEPDTSRLRESLREKLPDYMIPAAFVSLEQLPLTPNGKVDRRALPAPDSCEAESEADYVGPVTPVEEVLCGIWSDVLGRERMSTLDNFFDLGGHSLLITQVVSRIREAFKIEFPLRHLFESPTVASLAQRIEASLKDESHSEQPPLVPLERGPGNQFPLSFAQQRLWFLDQLEPGSPAYNVPAAIRLKGSLNVEQLERALNETIRRHEALRTSFVLGDGAAVQSIAPELTLSIPLRDLREIAEAERAAEAMRLAIDEGRRPFDLARGPLLRASLLRLREEEHVLLLTMHHIISDGWSMSILVREVAALYESFLKDAPSPLAELPIQYADFAVWQREWLQGEALEAQLSYWKERLRGHPAMLDLPVDYRRPKLRNSGGAKLSLLIPARVTRKLKELSRRTGATLFMSLLTAFSALLSRYSAQTDITIGSPIANRTRAETESLIGFFVNTLVLRIDLSGNPSFRELVERVREVCLGGYSHQDVPFEKLVEEIEPEREMSHSPLFQVMFVYQNTPMERPEIPGLSLEPLDVYSGTAKFDLVLNLHDTEQGLAGSLEYSTDLFKAATIERMIGHYLNLLEGVVADETRRISELPLLDESERNFILKRWNQVEIERPEQCLHYLFETQAELHPQALAISFQDERLSYSELNIKSNRIAHGLHTAGVRKGQRVALMLDYGPLQVVSFLGILKAGASFVCLDPHHPAARLEQILREVKPACLLTDSYWVARHRGIIQDLQQETGCSLALLNITNSEVLSIGLSDVYGGLSWLETYPDSNPVVRVGPKDLAYIVYTSGSTGTPKGIMQSHDSFCQFVEWMGRQFAIQAPKRIAQWASTTYDAAYAEIFGALCFGATLCMTTPETKHNPARLIEWLKTEKLSLFQTVPSFARQILDAVTGGTSEAEDENPLPHLEYMLLAGETLPVNLARDWLKRFPRQPKLYNLYGPTESVLATFHAVTSVQDEQTSIPIGRAIDGRQVFILDQSEQLCPIGVAGEIYIRSPYLTEGYFAREEETQKSFVQNPLHDEFPDRVYRTGDLGRWLSEGTLEFFGRVDNQVKIRGIRVELEDIEAALLRHPSVSECAVVAHDYAAGDRRIIAYVPASDELSATALRRFLEESLPDYMMPSAFIFLDTLPRTASGKIDRTALPPPDEQAEYAGEEEFTPARTPLEEELVEVWKEILQVESIGVHDNFFRLGGHSLLATVLVNRLRQTYAVELPLRSFLESPTVASLAASIETARLVGHQDLGQIEAMLERVKGLSDDEVKALLHQS